MYNVQEYLTVVLEDNLQPALSSKLHRKINNNSIRSGSFFSCLFEDAWLDLSALRYSLPILMTSNIKNKRFPHITVAAGVLCQGINLFNPVSWLGPGNID